MLNILKIILNVFEHLASGPAYHVIFAIRMLLLAFDAIKEIEKEKMKKKTKKKKDKKKKNKTKKKNFNNKNKKTKR